MTLKCPWSKYPAIKTHSKYYAIHWVGEFSLAELTHLYLFGYLSISSKTSQVSADMRVWARKFHYKMRSEQIHLPVKLRGV